MQIHASGSWSLTLQTRDVRILKCCVLISPRILTTDPHPHSPHRLPAAAVCPVHLSLASWGTEEQLTAAAVEHDHGVTQIEHVCKHYTIASAHCAQRVSLLKQKMFRDRTNVVPGRNSTRNSSGSITNANATNEGESADFAHFNCKNWLRWQLPLRDQKKRVKSVIYDQIIRVRMIPVLGYWVLANACLYWVVLVLAQYFS